MRCCRPPSWQQRCLDCRTAAWGWAWCKTQVGSGLIQKGCRGVFPVFVGISLVVCKQTCLFGKHTGSGGLRGMARRWGWKSGGHGLGCAILMLDLEDMVGHVSHRALQSKHRHCTPQANCRCGILYAGCSQPRISGQAGVSWPSHHHYTACMATGNQCCCPPPTPLPHTLINPPTAHLLSARHTAAARLQNCWWGALFVLSWRAPALQAACGLTNNVVPPHLFLAPSQSHPQPTC
jgi:hypothetical protein